MKLKGIMDQNFQDYKEISFYLAFPTCTFKCEKDLNSSERFCSNCDLVKYPTIEISTEKLVDRYLNNNLSKAIVCGGLEPLDSFNDLVDFISTLRKADCNDPVIIYTGYYENEVVSEIEALKQYPNIIVKFGRFVPNSVSHHDDILGITLASENQYARKIS